MSYEITIATHDKYTLTLNESVKYVLKKYILLRIVMVIHRTYLNFYLLLIS